MTLLYADTSAILQAYFADEPDHAELRALLLEGGNPVVSSEIARVELARAIRAAGHSRRLRRWSALLARVDADCGGDGPITLLRLRPETVLLPARRLVLDHRLHTLDAFHLAVALEECPRLADGDAAFVTRDDRQAEAAKAVGFDVR